MKPSNLEILVKIHHQLILIERDLAGYSALMGSIYEDTALSGADLIGPSNAIARDARKIQKIIRTLDLITINEFQK